MPSICHKEVVRLTSSSWLLHLSVQERLGLDSDVFFRAWGGWPSGALVQCLRGWTELLRHPFRDQSASVLRSYAKFYTTPSKGNYALVSDASSGGLFFLLQSYSHCL